MLTRRILLPLLAVILVLGTIRIWISASGRPNLYRVAQSLGLTTRPIMSDFQRPSAEGDSLPARREELTLMTFNIRYDNPLARRYPDPPGPDRTLPPPIYGEWSWAARRFAVSDIALFHSPDIVVFQEVLHSQLLDLAYLLGEDYDWVGVGRDDGKQAGEAVPVFYKRDKFSLASEQDGGVGTGGVEHFWLSETPSVVASVGWDAQLTRMCTHLALKLRTDAAVSSNAHPSLRAPIHVFSTHYDHKGVVARAKSSDLIVEKANVARRHSRRTTGLEPLVLLAGDLNSPREEQGWQNLVKGHHGVPSQSSFLGSPFSFYDLQLANPTRYGLPYRTDYSAGGGKNNTKLKREQSPQTRRGILSTNYGPPSSFTDWTASRDRSAAEDRIDFLMVGDNQPITSDGSSNEAGWKIKTVGIVSSWSAIEGGIRASDHRPVMARLRWEAGQE
ncbi:hypothetical protein BCV69DRAFT_284008 [Microstroma glucosiphilum]|uniref:Endonuclease/exonuclease/phosphatase domain-containing protein n=1 Tax=Pseudomicrostroma glucosiphilum TaxID=1684307 RepID=A0A316U8R5_9BASI|nr:hypothetical protein BCV69DRAFT_284008 [Pseudomicrostroma glucosiphilum]PWN19375.1 hypothetical protein BCV69DRAFT_284008 [Pseudomicrostroma glucosiphilum]